jgi:nicotinate phosphoribosyltransferase
MTDAQRSTDPLGSALFTDLYELTMAQAYHSEQLNGPAVFELFFRAMPESRNYIVAAGLGDVIECLTHWRFTDADLAYLRERGQFDEAFVDYLRELRFTGEVWAAPEGTVVFENEPVVQVVAPIIEAQVIETLVLNQVHFQSIAATKASRMAYAARGRAAVDFGSRRAHGADAAIKVARAAYLAGLSGTSNVEAGRRYGIPVFGTMAHSYVQAHDDEADAFDAFARRCPQTTLLVDTYDTLAGVDKVIDLARRQGEAFNVRAVRLDSGNLLDLAGQTRRKLDEAGLGDVKIFASSGLDEYAIAELLEAGAPIDGFGPGTKLAVSPDAPDLDMAYKLVSYDGGPRTKLSDDKRIYPGRKQVFRSYDAAGRMNGDTIAAFDQTLEGTPLLEKVMADGQAVALPSLDESREHCRRQLAALPEHVRALRRTSQPYPVGASDELQAQRRRCVERLQADAENRVT